MHMMESSQAMPPKTAGFEKMPCWRSELLRVRTFQICQTCMRVTIPAERVCAN